jgi:hypothetical protein
MKKKDIKMMRKMRVEYVRKEQQMRGLNPMFDLKIRLGDTPLPEGSVILLDTGDTK